MSPSHWQRVTATTLALLPLAALYAATTAARRWLFRRGILVTHRLTVPVIVVGNITAGGTGKTPFVIWLAAQLKARGFRPGIVTRGYRARDPGPARVGPDTPSAEAGDEPVLLARRSGCPVWRGVDRGRAAGALLAAHPECDIVVSDDGLQHYRLARDVEIALVDGMRGFGNRLPIPAGPMREPTARLRSCDFVVIKTPNRAAGIASHTTCDMALRPGNFVNLRDQSVRAAASALPDGPIHAVAGIGDPTQFFEVLRGLGLDIVEHPFPDHHAFVASDLAFGDSSTIVMTEKDAVKCLEFARERWWMLPVEAVLPPGFAERILAKLTHGTRSEAA
ncbi:MAG: tetraacyldisaccharide 4'-kinase [Betaproteobacteria bacterium]